MKLQILASLLIIFDIVSIFFIQLNSQSKNLKLIKILLQRFQNRTNDAFQVTNDLEMFSFFFLIFTTMTLILHNYLTK